MPLIKPIKVAFSPEVMDRMWEYVHNKLEGLTQEGQQFRDTDLPEWTRLLKGKPKSATKDFPFPNCSNLVMQLIATRVEQLTSRAMVIYQVNPLWTIGATGDLPGQEADEMAKVLEQFLEDQALDPEELALYRKEEIMIHNGIAYGTAFMGFPSQYLTECAAPSLDGLPTTSPGDFEEFVKRDGPSPENIPLSKVFISNKETDFNKVRFFARQVPLSREAIEDRIAFGVWSKEDGEAILNSPATINTLRYQNDGKHFEESANKYSEEFHVYECYFKFVHDRRMYSIKADYHLETRTKPSAVFNYNPKNMIPYEDLRFGYDDDQYYGYGFIEMLQGYQQEVSQIHNNRLDNETIKNTVAFRINKDSELASTLKIYPGVGVPADKDEIEILNTSNGAIDNMNSEQAAIAATNERSGIDPAISGASSGIVNSKRGIYSSQGTMAVLQQQNNRTGLRMMDIRGTHVKIGRKLLDMYANMGIGKRLARYGAQSENLAKALKQVKDGNLGLLLKASAGSNNIESDRQNSILLAGLQEKYIGTVNQILGAMQTPQMQENPDQLKFLQDVLFAQQSLTRHIFRSFNYFDVDKLVPFPEAIKNARYQQQQQPPSRPQQSSNIVPITNSPSSNPIPTASPTEQAG